LKYVPGALNANEYGIADLLRRCGKDVGIGFAFFWRPILWYVQQFGRAKGVDLQPD
jgi:hypothetical protein